MTERFHRRVVIGVGQEFRGDDGIGPEVVRRLATDRADGADVAALELDGEPSRLVDAWEGAAVAVVVDALAGVEPGSVHRIEVGPGSDLPAGPASSHGLGVGEAVALGRALGRLPEKLVVIGVGGSGFTTGSSLSPACRAAVPHVVALVRAELA